MRTLPCTLTQARVGLTSWFSSDVRSVLVLLALVTVIWLPRISGPIDLRGDGGVYYILGTSLAEGKGYRLLNEPGEIEAVQYPPLLPLIVAAHQWVLGTSDFLVVGLWLRIFYFLVYMGFGGAIYSLARQYLSPGYALLAALMCMLDLTTYYLSDMLYAEVPFALVTTLFVILHCKSEKVGYAMLTAVLGAAAYLLRTAGIALLVVWVAESLLRGRFKQMALRAAVALIPILLWQGYIAQVRDSQQYQQPAYAYQRAPYQYSNVPYVENMLLIKPFSPELGRATADEMFRRVAMNLIAMSPALGEALSVPIWFWGWPLRAINYWTGLAVLPLWPVIMPLVLLGCLVTAGMILLAFRREWFISLYFAASVGLIVLTPFPEQFPRYLTPLTPFLALALFCVLASLGEWCMRQCPGRWKKGGSVFSALVVTVIFLVESVSLVGIYNQQRYPVSYYDVRGNEVVSRLFFYFPSWRALDTSLEWLQQRANPGDVIATTVPHWAYLRTELKAVLPPMVVDSEWVLRLLDSVPVKYVVLDDLDYPGISQRYTAPVVEQHPNLWKCVYVAPGGQAQVYERVP
jgi:hypothetical protein